MRPQRQHLLLPLLPIPLLLLAMGCAHNRPEPEAVPAATKQTKTINSIKARAIVEFTKENTTKGRASITASYPDTFLIVIKGPIGTSAALIAGNKKGITFLWKGQVTTFKHNDPRLPFNIRSAELVSLLLGNKDFPPRENSDFETEDLPKGRSITKRVGNEFLYRAEMRDYRAVSGTGKLPFKIAIEGNGYKLLIKYTKVDVNQEINNSSPKTTR